MRLMQFRQVATMLPLMLGLAVTALAQPVAGRAVVIPIEGEITPGLARFVTTRMDRAEREGAAIVVLEINTPGGRVDAAEEITQRLLASTLPTVAVVSNAFSAGALISMAAEELRMLPGSSIGAATPLMATGFTAQPADAKTISALTAQFRSVAQARGRPEDIAEAMVNPRRNIPGLSAEGEPLTLTASQAVDLGIANGLSSSLPAAIVDAGFGRPEVARLEPTFLERSASFLSLPVVSTLLLAIGAIGIILELLNPGTFIPAGIGVAALALYFFGGYLAGLAGLLEFALFAGGVLLVLAEVFLTPGFGVAGVVGALAVVASVFLTFPDPGQAALVLSGAAVLTGAGTVALFRVFPGTRIAGRLILQEVAGDLKPNPYSELLGAEGLALTPLRPSGTALFGDRRITVVTEGDLIDPRSRVKVVLVEGTRVVVRQLEEA